MTQFLSPEIPQKPHNYLLSVFIISKNSRIHTYVFNFHYPRKLKSPDLSQSSIVVYLSKFQNRLISIILGILILIEIPIFTDFIKNLNNTQLSYSHSNSPIIKTSQILVELENLELIVTHTARTKRK